jgi:hypothetical protein
MPTLVPLSILDSSLHVDQLDLFLMTSQRMAFVYYSPHVSFSSMVAVLPVVVLPASLVVSTCSAFVACC